MMIFGEIPGAIIAIETDFKCFCLKCSLMNGISKEVYKPVSQKLILEKSECKDCGSTKRTFRKYAAYCKKTYKNMQHFGEQRTKKYNKLAWTVLAPEIQIGFSELKPSTVRGMEHLAVQRGLKPMKMVNKQIKKAQKTRTRQARGPFGGPFGVHISPPPMPQPGMQQQAPANPYYAYQNPQPQQQQMDPRQYGISRQMVSSNQLRNMEAARQQQEAAYQQQTLRVARFRRGRQGYHSPSCMCPHCSDLDRRNRRA